VKNTLDNEILKHRKDKVYLFLACTAAIVTSVCLYIVYLAIEMGNIGIAFLFTAAVLIFIWPLLVMFVIKYAERYKSLKWLIDLNGTDKRENMEINFIPL
jgi:FtsH-binding integral membrane protein